MPDEGPGRHAEDDLTGLLTERDALHRRLAWVDTRVTQLQSARQDVIVRRLASLEQAVLRLAPAAVDPRPVVAPEADRPTPFAANRVEARSSEPVRVERTAAAPLAAYTSPARDGQLVGWISRGSRLAVTDVTSGSRTQVIYQVTSSWVDTDGLILEPLPGSAPSPVAPLAPVAPSAPPTPPVSAQAPVPSAAGDAPETAPPSAQSTTSPPPVTQVGSPAWSRPGFMPKLLALVGAAVTLIGVAFLLILAAQYGLFGPLARTISAALLGVVLVALAFVVRQRDPGNVGAPILGATGVAAGFLSVVTATVIYGWLPPLAGVVLAALIGLGGMVLARLWDNEWVGLVSLLGSLLLAGYVGAGPEPVITAG